MADTQKYEHQHVILEGKLELGYAVQIQPLGCTNHCSPIEKPRLVGVAKTVNGASNVANVERLLEILNGRDVRVTVEYN